MDIFISDSPPQIQGGCITPEKFSLRLLHWSGTSFILINSPWDKHGFPLGMLLTPWTANVPVSSISRTVFLSSCSSSTVPCIHTKEASRERPPRSLTVNASPQSAVPLRSAVLNWPDSTLTGGDRFLSPVVFNMTDLCCLPAVILQAPTGLRKELPASRQTFNQPGSCGRVF